MALTNVQKKTRATVNDSWSPWANTTDAPPYTNTTLVEYRAVDAIDVNIEELTNGTIGTDADGADVWLGTGVFDRIMGAVNGNIKVQYDNGRIKDADYAQVYLGGLQASINSAIQFLLQEKTAEAQAALTTKQQNSIDSDISIKEAQSTADLVTKAAQAALTTKQQALVERQTQGFDDDAKQKLLKQALDSWSVAYSVAQDANSIPDSIKVNVIDSIMKNAYTALGVVKTNDPIGEA